MGTHGAALTVPICPAPRKVPTAPFAAIETSQDLERFNRACYHAYGMENRAAAEGVKFINSIKSHVFCRFLPMKVAKNIPQHAIQKKAQG